MGRAAYETIRDMWNAEHAAAALLRFVEKLRQGKIVPEQEGPLSIAPVIRPGASLADMERQTAFQRKTASE